MLLNCIHIVADYLVEDDIANGFFWSFIACSRYIQSSDWMSLAYHAVCSTEHWVVNFPFRFHPFYNAILLKSNKQQQITQNIFMFITKCLQWLLQWQMWIIITIITTTAAATLNYAVCVCVRDFYYIGLLFWSNFHLIGWHTGVCKGAFIHILSIKLIWKWFLWAESEFYPVCYIFEHMDFMMCMCLAPFFILYLCDAHTR